MTYRQEYIYYVYVLRCADKSYYIGVTNCVEKRLSEHNLGLAKNSFTYSRRPVTLLFQAQFNDIRHAINFEKQIKGWTRKKKEALINRDLEKLHHLAKCKNNTNYRNNSHPSSTLRMT